MARLRTGPPLVNKRACYRDFPMYEDIKPHLWNILLMTDLAVQIPEANRRLDAIDRRSCRTAGGCLSLGRRDRQSGRTILYALLEADPKTGGGRCHPASRRRGGPGQAGARHYRVRVGRDRRSLRAWLKNFAGAVSAMPEVMEFYRMAGDVDYMLRVVVPTWRAMTNSTRG